MKKLGIGKKDKSEDSEDSKRSHLFGGRSKSKSPAPPTNNPYAAPPGNDPYAKPAPGGYGQPPPYHNNPGGPPVADPRARSEKTAVPPGGYGGQRGYAQPQGGYGSQSGYGNSNPYGAAPSGAPARGGASGYGGLGNDDPNRNQLFGGAKDRYEERKQQQAQQPQQQTGLPPEDQSQLGGGYGSGGYGDEQNYKPYEERQLTAEEEEEEDVQATKDEIRAIKQQDVSSTRNALRVAQQAEETGRATLERLGAQGERIHNTERNLDMAASQNRLAEDKARELKHLNRSMWAMNVNNPFTKSRRARERDEEIMNVHRSERDRRDATRQAAWASSNRQQETARELKNGPGGAAAKKANLAERSKYQFEADSEDEAMEDEIDDNLEAMHGAVGRLNQLGKAMGKEVDVQNQHIDRIGGKTDQVDDQIAMNRARLDRIR